MVAHEDVRVHADVVLRHGVVKKVVEMLSVEVVDEDGATIDATLGDMKGSLWKLEAWATWHATSVARGVRQRSRPIGVIGVGRCQ